MNKIPKRQNEAEQIEKLAAQRNLYSSAKTIQAVQFILVGPVMVLIAIPTMQNPTFEPNVALLAIVIVASDALLLTPWVQRRRHSAARIQEWFDCDVLELKWSTLKAGAKPERETVIRHAAKYKNRDPDFGEVTDWYPTRVGVLPLAIARIVCQRSNCWWDAELRRRYARWISVSAAAGLLALLFLGLLGNFTVERFVLTVLTPALPLMLLGVRQYTANRATADRLDGLKSEVDRIWSTAIAGQLTSDELEMSSRQLQDSIYDHRCSAELIFDRVYSWLRAEHEEVMNRTAKSLIDEAQK